MGGPYYNVLRDAWHSVEGAGRATVHLSAVRSIPLDRNPVPVSRPVFRVLETKTWPISSC
jgi:hypothetical protein